MTLQEQIMKALHVQPVIDPKVEIRKRIDFLKDYLKTTGAKGFVLGISGGQDSTLAGRLAQLAVEEVRNEGGNATFISVRLPYKVQKDEDDAQLALQFIQADQSVAFDIASTVDAFSNQYENLLDESLTDFNKGNVKARIRMVTQYAIGGQQGLLVIGTDHAAEAVTGFFTKFGDGGADLLPLTGLTKRQGRDLLQELGADERLYLKMPTADLLDEKPGQADETELGITYDQLDDYLEGKSVPADVAEKIEKRYKVSEHKRQVPASMFDDWWK
ncbi:ammonia-dependent NAD(+) synthetase [Bacillus mycoides]|jgi:NAD+ synthase|uniref:NH(3)-dependent NAD(+) synthetase n=2 Tax=Bacillus cereus group TaxID=86661 RepID=R8HLA9_BACCE|nr:MULTISPECIES: ammonia-dependent NAD(+) synthetase [Bacillus]EEL06686.1 NH(3)-dependent NAD(+) synthetase [Bacillus cereus BDRD-ST196]EJS08934.1 NH(3)-dependent NAD(+) synthetase [Bacillus cereus VDM034]EJS12774.1 NH(3)-dependent NAD(+) synthetase [Bacillus cereus VDM062]KXY30622.1 NAD(+) synthetase [Bacillus cereus]MBK5358308.1 ammonia-dependent NAD(+) synthetase [Bacillus sp. TH44]